MTFSGYLKQTKCMKVFKKWCETRWKYFWCDHEYEPDPKSLSLPMPIVYYCKHCNKFKG